MSNIVLIKNIVGQLAANCYSVMNTVTRETIVIDPGAKPEFLINMFKQQNMKIVAILITHGHFDHTGGLNRLKEEFPDVPVYSGKEEKKVMEQEKCNLSGMFGEAFTCSPTHLLEDGEVLNLNGTTIRCIHIPGHTQGGMSYYFEEEGMLFTGDSLFKGTIGRSDFPTGDEDLLLTSIREKLFVLPEDVEIFPGHNDKTTVGFEKNYNQFFR